MQQFSKATLRANAKRLCTAVVMTGLAFVVGCGKPGPSQSNFGKVNTGMSETEVVEILGTPSENTSATPDGAKLILWDQVEDGKATGKKLEVILKGGKVESKQVY